MTADFYQKMVNQLQEKNVTLVAVSKTKSVNDIKVLYDLGQRDFGENYVQELIEKYKQLPKDIRWHFIGHLQRNKVKQIAPFIYLIHSVDSEPLLIEINKQAEKNNRIIDCLLQIYIAKEETKFGLDENELSILINAAQQLNNVQICGLMGMASFSDDANTVRKEFKHLKAIFDQYDLQILSMGMSSDYQIAVEEGSTMVRIGSLLFGKRTYN